MFPQNIPDPCTLHDQWLQNIENSVLSWDPATDDSKFMKRVFGSLITSLRQNERERVRRIINTI